MEPFVIATPADEAVQVPFSVPVKGEEPFEFTLTRMTYLDEAALRKMRDAIKAVDAFVPQVDIKGDTIWRIDPETGETQVDEKGEKVPLMGIPQRTRHERTRAIAEAMLKVAASADVFRRLQKLTVGELDQIVGHWAEVSASKIDGASQGESSASSTS
ncbi:hypothetical protein B5566_02445 [Mycobacterium sp. MHSD3]|nr:hypothetical protein B5566_02445 [Mycobacterium sp. MHSD3]